MATTTRIDGLKEFARDLAEMPEVLDADTLIEMKLQAMGIKDRATAFARARSHPRPGSRVISTISAASTGDDAGVSFGSEGVPWAMGHEFGSGRFNQFPSPSRGYFFYRAIREAAEKEIPDAIEKVIDEYVHRTFD